MEIKELMRGRYKIIETYPDTPFSIGEMIYQDEESIYYYNEKGKMVTFPNEHPAIFKKIEWWEYRSISEMPQYLKVNTERTALFLGNVHEVRLYDTVGETENLSIKLMSDRHKSLADMYNYWPNYFLPATKEEYELQNKKEG